MNDPTVTASVLNGPEYGTGGIAAPSESLPLSPNELDVLRLMARGTSNTEIADELFVSELTVKSHIGHIFTKLDLRDRAAAIVYAYNHRLCHPTAVIADALLDRLRAEFGAPTSTTTNGRFGSAAGSSPRTAQFSLTGVPHGRTLGPMVLRLFAEPHAAQLDAWEATVKTVVHDRGLPTPRWCSIARLRPSTDESASGGAAPPLPCATGGPPWSRFGHGCSGTTHHRRDQADSAATKRPGQRPNRPSPTSAVTALRRVQVPLARCRRDAEGADRRPRGS